MSELFFGALIASCICLVVALTHEEKIESKKPIIPEMIITTKGSLTDTLYIYRAP